MLTFSITHILNKIYSRKKKRSNTDFGLILSFKRISAHKKKRLNTHLKMQFTNEMLMQTNVRIMLTSINAPYGYILHFRSMFILKGLSNVLFSELVTKDAL